MAFGRFLKPLVGEWTEESTRGRQYFRLTEPFTYEVGERFSGVTVTVPPDYETDFASIPPIFWPIFPPTGMYLKAAVIHDWLYSTQGVSRVVADAVFLEAMGALIVPKWQRWAIYLAVRLGGWVYFRKGARSEP